MVLLGEPEETQRHGVTVVVVPYPAQGHLIQLLHLSLHLSSHGLSVHYATSPSHILQAKSRLQGWHPNSLQSIHFRASFEGCFTPALVDFIITNHRLRASVAEAGSLINTCRPVEGEFIDRLARQPSFLGKRLFAIGPLNPTILSGEDLGRRQHDCLEWLDKQPPASVVYVSFGTLSTVPDEQIEGLAIGLQRSRQRFIWVCREADRGMAHGESQQRKLPAEYERMVEGVGMVVSGWAPQLEILAHPATGAFMSHCGWNSCMESISMGVPILAWPMQSDQPSNAMLVTRHLKVGIMVREWARREEIVSSAGIEESIKRVMVYDGGKEIRQRAEALGELVRGAMAEGGSSRAELDSFIARISR